MKKISIMMAILFLILTYAVFANGTTVTIGQAEYLGSNYNLIWDNDSPFGSIVWLDYSNTLSNWDSQVEWANGLNSSGVLSYSINPDYSITWNGDWRLPLTVDGPFVNSNSGTTTAGYNITSSEMGHLYYSELGNLGFMSTGDIYQPDHGLANTGSFTNLQELPYWSATEYNIPGYYPNAAWYFRFDWGFQDINWKDTGVDLGLAVRPADVTAVPEPATMLLLGSGLIGLVGYGRKKLFEK